MTHAPQSHGSIPYAELRQLQIDPSTIMDFSATVNPFPLPQSIRDLFTGDGIAAYPDPESCEAGAALAAHHRLPYEWMAITAGLTETLFILPLLYEHAVEFAPTYGDYAAAYIRHRRSMVSVSFPSTEPEFYAVIDSLRKKAFQLLIICNPNNPTGQYLPAHRIQELCEVFSFAAICVDESYQEMGENCDSAISLTTRFRNLLILKSLTKPFGIGGLRAGYAVSSGGVLKRIRQYLMPWGVSSLAQRIIPALVANYALFQHQWKLVHAQKRDMMQQLSRQGFVVASGECPFFLVKTKDAEQKRRMLLSEHHIAVRSCASFGMPQWIRIMPGRPEQNLQLLDILARTGHSEAT